MNKKYSIKITFVLLVVSLYQGTPTLAQEQQDIQRVDSITYCQRGDVNLQLDLAQPKSGHGSFPLLIFIHGGGWREGNRGQYYDEIAYAAKNNFVAVTITHRLTQDTTRNGKVKHPWPAALQDVKCAIRFLKTHAEKYNIIPDKIGITGHSSGGHLALMAGLKKGSTAHNDPGVSGSVQAVVNMSGPTEMVSVHKAPVVKPYAERLLGGSPGEFPERYRRANPIHYISEDAPPIMTIHGAKDEVVPVEQAKKLDRAMEKFSAAHTLVIFNNQPHVYQDEGAEKARQKRMNFFKKHLK